MERWLSWRRGAGLGLLAVLLLIGLYGIALQGTYSVETDVRGAAGIVQSRYEDGDALVLPIPYLRHSMEYYLGQGRAYVDGPYTNSGLSLGEVDLQLREALSQHRRAWLLLSESEMWDQRGLTLQWFRGNAELLGEWELARVRVYLFRLP